MEESIAKEVLFLLKNNHDLMIALIIIFGVLFLIAFAAMAFLFIKFRAGLNLIERYHRIFNLSDIEEYVSLVKKKADLKVREDYDARLTKIRDEAKEKGDLLNKMSQSLAAFFDELGLTLLKLVVEIPRQVREQAIESHWRGNKTHAMKHFLNMIRSNRYLIDLGPSILDEETGKLFWFADEPKSSDKHKKTKANNDQI